MTNNSPKPMKRRSIRKAELLEICERQYTSIYDSSGDHLTKGELHERLFYEGECECGCGKGFIDQDDNDIPVANGPEYDHKIPNALLYEGDPIQWRVFRKSCHAKKTKDDVKRIAKAKRQAGETGQYARRKRRGESSIPSRPDPWNKKYKEKTGYKHKWGRG